MSTYIITGKVKADSLQTPLGTWYGVLELPMFRVDADSTTEASQLAKEIIDPLETTEVHATAVEELPGSSTVSSKLDAELNALLSGAPGGFAMIPRELAAMLSAELGTAAEALTGDSNDAEHDALYNLAGAVAAVLGLELDDLLDEDEEDE